MLLYEYIFNDYKSTKTTSRTPDDSLTLEQARHFQLNLKILFTLSWIF